MYRKLIIELSKCTTEEARLVEGYMRLEFGTLDHLTRAQFKKAAKEGYKMVCLDPDEAELLAQSYGLR